ncbi:hypothetical protein Poli38472_002815 [Pythium oligandrum]|uniref:Uncharacterized protein n=1 Tax=Pythium oligandrum TaxID=41045 RepID=A0A8K1C5N3_PYTOL|nr:hypothetical protein Poli38472_002815 [Pythium oligandrum]|eukprot:TMW56890.1 hypothetical protein Poli38472_002815 [Pythium oligandrum]
MQWRRLVVALAASVLQVRADQFCPEGQFSVSVLDNPVVQCLGSRPCSGAYGPDGLVGGVGACPSGTGCALLPQNEGIMACVPEGRDDVSYVNPDGSLTRGGKIISGPPTNKPDNTNNKASSDGSGKTDENDPSLVRPDNSTSSSDTSVDLDPETSSSLSGVGSSSSSVVKPSAAPTPAPAPAPSTTEPTTSVTPSTSSSQVNQQSALDDISGDASTKMDRGGGAAGMGLAGIIAIVIGCLAVVAIVAGVFVLRRKKEDEMETPVAGAAALDEYGVGCITPKENVLLL